MYSWVAPGPPWSSKILTVGLLPTRFVQTLKMPFGVLIGIIFTPPDRTSSRPVLSKYTDAGAGADDATGGVSRADEHADVAMTALRDSARRFMATPSFG